MSFVLGGVLLWYCDVLSIIYNGQGPELVADRGTCKIDIPERPLE